MLTIEAQHRGHTIMIMARLKEETHVYHKQLEQNPYSKQIMSEQPTLSVYQVMLQKFYGFYTPMEARIGTFGNFEARRKAHLLAQDLSAMGLNPAQLAVCPELPRVESLAQALGCMYVMEGATLGGSIISRHLKKHLSAEVPFAFYSSYGENLGMMWKAFGSMVSDYTSTPQLEDEIVAAASDTFVKMERWLQPEVVSAGGR